MDHTVAGTGGKKGRRAGKRMLERYNGSKLDWLHDSLFFIILIVVIFLESDKRKKKVPVAGPSDDASNDVPDEPESDQN